MDIWKVLEIEATRDKKAIKKAYRARLPFVNPEDDQEAFMELREAYEEALRLAELPDESEGSGTAEVDNSEAGIFRRELEALYWDFYRRIDTEEWRRLLACDFATALDTKKGCGEHNPYFYAGMVSGSMRRNACAGQPFRPGREPE